MASFGSKELAMLLPDKMESRRNDDNNFDQIESKRFAPKIDATKRVQRYYAGQAPQWDQDQDQDQDHQQIVGVIDRGPGVQGKSIEPPIDRRLARLAASGNTSLNNNSNISSNSSSSNSGSSRRRIYEAQVVVDLNDDDGDGKRDHKIVTTSTNTRAVRMEEKEDVEDVMAHRLRAIQRAAEQKSISIQPSEHLQQQLHPLKEEQEEHESSSEYETDSDESSSSEDQPVLKPVFVPRTMRKTVSEEEAKLAAEEAALLTRASLLEERKLQTRTMVAESIKRVEEAQNVDLTDADSDAGLPDDFDDPLKDDEEFEEWKLRELKRLKRDFEAKELLELEKADLERRRHMTDEERRREDEGLGKFQPKEKKAIKFMQKYYHKGVFFMDESSIKTDNDVRLRDYVQPTGEDKFNIAALPAVMQVRKFGMKGRTKYTHLLDQDTTAKVRPLGEMLGGGRGRGDDIDGAGRLNKRPKM